MRLIDAEAEIEKIRKKICGSCRGFSSCGMCSIAKIMRGLENAPTIEAKPVVYCKDCKYSRMYCFGDCEELVLACCDIDDDGIIYCAESVNEYDYCSKGEKREAKKGEAK